MSPRRVDPIKVEPYTPGKCEVVLPTGKRCGKPAHVWLKIGANPGLRVCPKCNRELDPPPVVSPSGNPPELQDLIDDETFPGGLQGARR